MSLRSLLLILSLSWGWGAIWMPLCAQTTTSEGTALSPAQWASVQTRCEGDISALVTWLKDYQNNKNVLTADIADLQAKTNRLRGESRGESNVFKDIRLKELLNDLKDKLEQNSKADREAEVKQKELEQKSLSLIELYNNRIEALLAEGDITEPGSVLDARVNQLTDLARRRNHVQALLTQYKRQEQIESPATVNASIALKSDDQQTLQLTLDLFKDRQKNMKDQLSKWNQEADGIKNELKLQGEMRDFLKDIQNLNADSNFPQGDLKQEDLEFLSTDTHKKKLTARLNEVQQRILQGQKELMQLDALVTKVQTRLDLMGKGKKT